MYIERIHLKNYRSHEDLVVAFRRGMTVIAGVNGAGKTSLLNGICEVLTKAVPPQELSSLNPFQDPDCVHVKVLAPHGRARFEAQFPVQISATGYAHGQAVNWSVTRFPSAIHAEGLSPNEVRRQQSDASMPHTTNSQMRSLPVVAFYRANRAWQASALDAVASAIERNSRNDGYESWLMAGADADALQRWIVAKSLERLQVASESGQAFSSINSDELAQIARALDAALDSFGSIRYDFQSKKILVDWQVEGVQRDSVAFEHLSAGQRAVICLVADIARRMCLLNPHLGDNVIAETEGVVLIDELDMHLHPEWQRALTRGLMKAFPKVQFIVASHSPQVIGELDHENVILLTPDGAVNPSGSFGMTSNQVLQELMDAEVRATPVKQKLDEIDEALTRNQLDQAEEKIRALASVAPELRELAGAEALLLRKRTIGR